MKYNETYKCRLCGKEFSSRFSGKGNAMNKTIEYCADESDYQRFHGKMPHLDCPRGFGVGDFIGWVKEDD